MVLEMCGCGSIREGIAEVIDAEASLAGFPEQAHNEECHLEAAGHSIYEPAYDNMASKHISQSVSVATHSSNWSQAYNAV